MPWYSFADIFDWINYFLWSNYDPTTDTHISPCALKNDPICTHEYVLGSTYDEHRMCLLRPDYCIFTGFITLIVIIIFSAFGIVAMCALCSGLWDKTDLEKKHVHIE